MGERDTSAEREAEIRQVLAGLSEQWSRDARDLLAMLDEAREALRVASTSCDLIIAGDDRTLRAYQRDRDEAIARADAAEAALAALREAVRPVREAIRGTSHEEGHAGAVAALDAALADAAPAAEAYRARVRREVLREAADKVAALGTDERRFVPANLCDPDDHRHEGAADAYDEAADALRAMADEEGKR